MFFFIKFRGRCEKFTMENMVPSLRVGRAFGFPRPPRPPPSPTTVEPCQSPPFQDCWDGNLCQLDNQCGNNGRCKILMHDSCRPTGYVHIQKFKAHFQSCSLDKKRNCKLFVKPRDNLVFIFYDKIGKWFESYLVFFTLNVDSQVCVSSNVYIKTLKKPLILHSQSLWLQKAWRGQPQT